MDCIFCDIIAGNAPADIVYEDAHVISFLPLKFATPGQTLVVPKVHTPNFLSIPVSAMEPTLRACKFIGRALFRAMDADGMNLITSAGSAATQTVWHLHFHLCPRFDGDRADFPLWGDSGPITVEQRLALVDNIQAESMTEQGGDHECT